MQALQNALTSYKETPVEQDRLSQAARSLEIF
jgi:hypothetical protein